ncbi:hypothetical protein L1987_18254 [Smallanthus sonchifolius]|uniref:Uncharacterized protein n=1 Tax=Smallanthus sonchifolius TaxID=185202 RepID=A0ACB9J1D3_9ASTR|nr:hypothetical protein L1987_18254 [Smallanthus sonchifolius]
MILSNRRQPSPPYQSADYKNMDKSRSKLSSTGSSSFINANDTEINAIQITKSKSFKNTINGGSNFSFTFSFHKLGPGFIILH